MNMTEETPGGDQPLAKAEGNITGYQTQLAEARAYLETAQERVALADARAADERALVDRTTADIATLEEKVAEAEAALPAAREAQIAYDAANAAPLDEAANAAPNADLN